LLILIIVIELNLAIITLYAFQHLTNHIDLRMS
jgi:hypothetical protein